MAMWRYSRESARQCSKKKERRPGQVLDQEFISGYTSGFEEFAASIKDASWDEITEQSDISRGQIEEAQDLYEAERTIFCWAMGLTQHKNAVANIQEIVNLMLLRGQIGKTWSRTLSCQRSQQCAGRQNDGNLGTSDDAFLARLGSEFNFEPPRRHGYDTVKAIEAMHEKKARVFFALGGNFLSATPDTEYTAEALRRCSMTAHVSTKPQSRAFDHGGAGLDFAMSRTHRD